MEDFCVSLLVQLRGRRQSYKSTLKEGQLAPAETQGLSLTRGCQMEQMTGTSGAYIGVTTAHSCTHTRRRMAERAAVAPIPLPLLSGLTSLIPLAFPHLLPRLLLIRRLHGGRTHTHTDTRTTRRIPHWWGCWLSKVPNLPSLCSCTVEPPVEGYPKPWLSIVSDELNIILLKGNCQEVKQKEKKSHARLRFLPPTANECSSCITHFSADTLCSPFARCKTDGQWHTNKHGDKCARLLVLNTWRTQGFWSWRRRDKRQRTLTLCTSCWDIGN